MALQVAFRLDASAAIGTGHLMRCLAIADQLKQSGWDCHFLCFDLPESLASKLGAHSLHPLTDLDDLTPLQKLNPDWLIVDHYALDARFERTARPYCQKIMVLDDLADRPHEADLLLDQGPLRTATDYQQWLPKTCQLLLGTRYALLRPEFRQLARYQCAPFSKGLICFGGSDPTGATLAALYGLRDCAVATLYQWTVVAGAANPFWDEITQFVATHPKLNIQLLRQTQTMAELLAQHDFTLGAAGGMTWERACLGIPTIAVPIVENQIFNAEVIQRYRLAPLLNLEQLRQGSLLAAALTDLAHNAEDYRRRGQALVDGLGLERLLNALSAPPIHIH